MKGEIIKFIDLFNEQNVLYYVGPIQRNIDWDKSQIDYANMCLWQYTSITQNRPHYMDSMVLKKYASEDVKRYASITDGQQRTTWLYLNICAICAFVKNNGISKDVFDYEDIYYDYLINSRKKGDYKYKLILRRKDRDTLKKIVDELPSMLYNEGNSRKLVSMYNKLYSRLTLSNYKTIWKKLNLLTIFVGECEEHEDEQQIYESINMGGKSVSSYDKIRSYLLSPFAHEKQDILEEKYFEKMPSTSFITTFIYFKAESVLGNDNYLDFRELYPSLKHAEDIMKEMLDFAEKLNLIKHANTGDKSIDEVLEGISLILPSTSYPAIYKIYDLYLNNHVSKNELLSSLNLICNTYLRCKLKGGRIDSLTRAVFDNISWISSDNLYGRLYKKLQIYFIEDGEFKEILSTKNMYQPKKTKKEEVIEEQKITNLNKLLKYMLIRIENNHHGAGRINPDEYSIEHICPQTLDNGWEHFFSDEHHKSFVHILGNLTLLAKAYNSSCGNDSFQDKLNNPHGFKDDKLFLNQSIVTYVSWTVDSIRDRTKFMADVLCEIFSIKYSMMGHNENNTQSMLVGGK